jgi:hypothetical protein
MGKNRNRIDAPPLTPERFSDAVQKALEEVWRAIDKEKKARRSHNVGRRTLVSSRSAVRRASKGSPTRFVKKK